MPPTVIELRPDRSLLNSEFEGYKLSLENSPMYRKELPSSADRVLPNKDQYSLLHAKIFGLHNHLVGEMIDEKEYVYFVDESRNINKVSFDPLASELVLTSNLWTVPNTEERTPGDFNISFKLVSDDVAVLADGTGILHILQTGSRKESDTWNCVFSDDVLDRKETFIVVDSLSRLDETKGLFLHCLLLRIAFDEATEKYATVLNWVTFSKGDDDKWGQVAIRELQAAGNVHYAHFEMSGEALYVASDAGFKFTIDSERPILEDVEEVVAAKKKYMWTQTKEDVTVHLKLPPNFNKSHLKIEVNPSDVCIKYLDEDVLSGDLQNGIDSDLSTWTVEHNSLEIVLYKNEVGLMWSELVKDNSEGEYFVDQTLAEEIHHKLAHLCNESLDTTSAVTFVNNQELEECDFEENYCATFERLCAKTHKTTHKISLNSHKFCLVVQNEDNLPPAIALTHDVDACIWQPQIADNSFAMKHVGTLLAFGYIQASKQQRKFSVCAPDLGYSAVCEISRHIFIYRQNKPILNAQLRNRTTSKKIAAIAQQQVVNLDGSEVLGIYAGNSLLVVLNENYIYALKI